MLTQNEWNNKRTIWGAYDLNFILSQWQGLHTIMRNRMRYKKKTQKRIMVIAWPDTMIYYFVVVKFDPSPPHVQRAWCEPSIAECSEVIIFYASATPLQLWILMIILKVQRAVYFIECTHSLLWLFKYIGIIFQFELLLLQCSNKCEAFCMLQQSTQYAMQCTH